MIFGSLLVADAERFAEQGRVAVLAHSLRLPDKRTAKGTRMTEGTRMAKGTALDAPALARLRGAGIAAVEAALPEPGDVGEDEAATLCAIPLLGFTLRADRASTGRVNLRAAREGLFIADADAVDRLNGIDPRLTIATLPNASRVREGELVATVKIIPFFAPADVVQRWQASAEAGAIQVHPWRAVKIAQVSTVLDSTKSSVLHKTRRALEARLDGTGAVLPPEVRVRHGRDALATALKEAMVDEPDLLIVFGASAVTDERDVVPGAILEAGGTVERVGMPVDPGNLLVLGRLGSARVIGAPGCARSPAPNGFDLVLHRVLAGLPLAADDLSRMGVGGLLKETPRPRPREARDAHEGGDAS